MNIMPENTKNDVNINYYKILTSNQKRDILHINDELNASKLTIKVLSEEIEQRMKSIIEFDTVNSQLEIKNEELEEKIVDIHELSRIYRMNEESFEKTIAELNSKNEELQNNYITCNSKIQHYKNLLENQKIEVLRMNDEINSLRLLIKTINNEMDIQRKNMFEQKQDKSTYVTNLETINSELMQRNEELTKENQNVVYWIEENDNIRKSLTFRAGKKCVDILNNPLKIFISPYWIISGIIKQLKKRKQND